MLLFFDSIAKIKTVILIIRGQLNYINFNYNATNILGLFKGQVFH
jgi:hypothetical protein